jgi:hypothetical protein
LLLALEELEERREGEKEADREEDEERRDRGAPSQLPIAKRDVKAAR